MNKLPGLGFWRMQPLTTLARSHLFRNSGELKNQYSMVQKLGPISNLLSMYTSICYCLMCKISAESLRRRSNMSFLEKRLITNLQATNAGHDRPSTTLNGVYQGHTLKAMSTSKILAGLQSSRTYATLIGRSAKSRSSKRSKCSVERPMAPIFSYAKYSGRETKRYRENNSHCSARLWARETPKERVKNVDKEPMLQTMRKISETTSKNISSVPRSNSFRTYPEPTTRFSSGTYRALRPAENCEARLRAIRQAEPFKLKVPAAMNRGQSRLYFSRKPQQLIKKYGSSSSRRPSTLALPTLKSSKMSLPYRSSQAKKLPYQTSGSYRTRAPKTVEAKAKKAGKTHKLPEKTAKHLEQVRLGNLLGDLLERKPRKTKGKNKDKIQFSKESPLCKVVTSSMERRSELHTRTFNKRLEPPQFYAHPTTQIYRSRHVGNAASRRQSSSARRR